jgi:hypothetical protein
MTFCIYSNAHVADDDSNEEHIFPLTLGGSNAFTIQISKASNARSNRELDEKLKSCLFLATNRKIHDARGHKNKLVMPPKAKITVGSDKSVILKFDENGFLQLYSHRRQKLLTTDELKEEGATIEISQKRSLRLKFTAKIALASGYFVYGNTFTENAETSELRALMHYQGELHDEVIINNIASTGWYWPAPVGDGDAVMHGMFERINRMFDCSFVALITSAVADKIIIVVGVLGHLIGVISCPANCDAFPKSGDYDLGHVVVLRDRQLKRMSFHSCLLELMGSSNRD